MGEPFNFVGEISYCAFCVQSAKVVWGVGGFRKFEESFVFRLYGALSWKDRRLFYQ